MIADIISIVVGFVAADKFPLIAKVVLYFKNSGGDNYQEHLAEMSLVVLFVFSFIAVSLGAIFCMRGWVTERQIMLSMFTAIIVAAFTIVDQSLPNSDGDTRIKFGNTIYYLGWLFVLYLIAPLLLPRVGDGRKMRAAVFLMAVSCLVALACCASSAILVEVARLINPALVDALQGGAANFQDPLRFWIIRPSIVGPIAGASVVVAFAPLWWPHLWSESRRLAKCAWIVGYSLFSVAYAGLYGKVVFARREWVESLVAYKSISDWRFLVVFAAYAGVVFVAVGLCFLLTRDKWTRTQGTIGWPVKFWWMMPLFLGVGLVAAVWLLVLLVATYASAEQKVFLIIAHFVAGLVLGFSLQVFRVATRVLRVLLAVERN